MHFYSSIKSLLILLLSGILFLSCASTKNTLALKGTWVLVEFKPENQNLRKPEISITMTLEDSTYQLGAHNRYQGTYTTDDNGHIQFKPGISTRMARLEDEARFIEIFFNVNHYKIQSRELYLENKDKNTKLIFERE